MKMKMIVIMTMNKRTIQVTPVVSQIQVVRYLLAEIDLIGGTTTTTCNAM